MATLIKGTAELMLSGLVKWVPILIRCP
jgi:hypothetical protein